MLNSLEYMFDTWLMMVSAVRWGRWNKCLAPDFVSLVNPSYDCSQHLLLGHQWNRHGCEYAACWEAFPQWITVCCMFNLLSSLQQPLLRVSCLTTALHPQCFRPSNARFQRLFHTHWMSWWLHNVWLRYVEIINHGLWLPAMLHGG